MSSSSTRQITGVLLKPDATPFANSSITVYRDKREVVPQGNAAIVDEVLRTVTGPGGEVSMALVPGRYLGQIQLSDADRYFQFAVPDGAGPFLIQDLIGTSPVNGAQYLTFMDLVLAARAWAENPEDAEVIEGEEAYSALHWAAKAEEHAQSASQDGSAAVAHAQEWAQSLDPVSADAGGDGSTDRSAKYWAGAAESAVSEGVGHAEEWAQSPDPISPAAGGDGATDRSAKWWANEAENARDVALGAMTTVVDPQFSTKGSAEAWHPDVAPNYIRTAGLNAPVDGQGGLFGPEGTRNIFRNGDFADGEIAWQPHPSWTMEVGKASGTSGSGQLAQLMHLPAGKYEFSFRLLANASAGSNLRFIIWDDANNILAQSENYNAASPGTITGTISISSSGARAGLNSSGPGIDVEVTDLDLRLVERIDAEDGSTIDITTQGSEVVRYFDPEWEDHFVSIPYDFPDLQSAVGALSRMKMRQGKRIVLVVERGHSLSSGLVLLGGDYSAFWIETNGPEIVINDDFDPALDFITGTNCRMPVLAALVDAGRYVWRGYAALASSSGWVRSGCGVKNAENSGLYANNSVVTANSSIWTGCHIGGQATRLGDLHLEGANLSNARLRGVYASRQSRVAMENAVATDCAEYGVRALRSRVHATGVDVSRAGQAGFFAAQGSNITCPSGVASDCGVYGVRAEASFINAAGVIADNNGEAGISSDRGSFITADGVKARGNVQKDLMVTRGGAIAIHGSAAETTSGTGMAMLADTNVAMFNVPNAGGGIGIDSGIIFGPGPGLSPINSTAAAPQFRGQIAFAGGEIWMGRDTAGPSDWVRISQ